MTDTGELTLRQQASLEKWKNIIAERNRSGMGIKPFCREHNLSHHAYYYWMKKIDRLAADAPACSSANPVQDAKFIRLPALPAEPATSFGGEMKLHIGGALLEITGVVSQAALRNVVLVLKEMAT